MFHFGLIREKGHKHTQTQSGTNDDSNQDRKSGAVFVCAHWRGKEQRDLLIFRAWQHTTCSGGTFQHSPQIKHKTWMHKISCGSTNQDIMVAKVTKPHTVVAVGRTGRVLCGVACSGALRLINIINIVRIRFEAIRKNNPSHHLKRVAGRAETVVTGGWQSQRETLCRCQDVKTGAVFTAVRTNTRTQAHNTTKTQHNTNKHTHIIALVSGCHPRQNAQKEKHAHISKLIQKHTCTHSHPAIKTNQTLVCESTCMAGCLINYHTHRCRYDLLQFGYDYN